MNSRAVVVDSIARSFKERPALAGISFSINKGEVVALLGPNGAGKTTAVRILTGVLKPDSGTASVLGLNPVTHGNDVRNIVGVMTEQAGLDDRLTATENIAVHGVIRGLETNHMNKRITELLEQFELGDRANDLVGGFSTGQRRRVSLARALLHDPEVLLLDEPTSGLDPESTRDVLDLIAGLAHDRGRTVLYCTHFLHEAGRLCERMVVLRQGKVMAFGKPADIAAELFTGGRVKVNIGHPADDNIRKLVADQEGVLETESTELGVDFMIEQTSVIPGVIAAMVQTGTPIFGVISPEPTMEDVYFALSKRPEGL